MGAHAAVGENLAGFPHDATHKALVWSEPKRQRSEHRMSTPDCEKDLVQRLGSVEMARAIEGTLPEKTTGTNSGSAWSKSTAQPKSDGGNQEDSSVYVLVDMGQCIQWCAVYHLGIFYLVHLILFPLELPDAVQQQYLAAKLPKSDTILSVIARTTLTRRAMESHIGTVHLNALMILYVCGFSTWCCTTWHPKNNIYAYMYIYIYIQYLTTVCSTRITPHLWENTPAPLSNALRIPFTSSVSKGHHRQTDYCRLRTIPWGQNWWRNGYNNGI